MRSSAIFLGLAFIFLSSMSHAAPPTQAGTYQRISDPIYDTLDLLVAHRLIPQTIKGIRPFTRPYIASLLQKAIDACSNGSKKSCEYSLIRDTLAQAKAQYADDLTRLSAGESDIKLLDEVALDITYLDSPSRLFFRPSPSARYNPLVHFREGRSYQQGFQYSIESTHRAALGDHVSLSLRPRLQIQSIDDRGGSGGNKVFLEDSYASFNFANTQFDLGRTPLQLGQGKNGGMMLSDNARSLDGLRVSNPFPWHLGFLGAAKYSFFLATLGPEQNFKHPLFSGLKFNVQPWKLLEIGIARSLILGGEGSPNASLGQHVSDYFGVRPGDINATNLSNSINGFELRATIPPLGGAELYTEFYFDDVTPTRLFRSFEQDTGILAGINVPRLNKSGSLGLRVEAKRTSPIMYLHSVWTTGWAMNGHVMGDPLGTDGKSLRILLSQALGADTKITNDFVIERVDSALYFAVNASTGRVKFATGIPEDRFRNTIKVSRRWNDRWDTDFAFGYERVRNFNFITGASTNNFLGDIFIRYRFD